MAELDDAREAYDFGMGVLRDLRAAWVAEGRPASAVGGSTGRTPVPHPLLREIREQEKLTAALRLSLGRSHRGPKPSAVIEAPSSSKLRRVG